MEPSVPIRLIKDNNEDEAAPAVIIQIRENLKLLDTPAEESGRLSIYKIPQFMREVHRKAIEPQLVSFGPYHHEKSSDRMELEKLKAFQNFQTKSGLPVEHIVEGVWSMLKDLQGSYDELEADKWKLEGGSANFLKLMVMDGCFMLEVLQNNNGGRLSNMREVIKRDMLLLENQLPMKLLEKLHSMAKHSNSQNVKSLVCNFMDITKEVEDMLKGEYLHVLEMYRDTFLVPAIVEGGSGKGERKREAGEEEEDQEEKGEWTETQIIRPATLLREAGIMFRWNESKRLTDVHFDKGGVLSLPKMVVDDDTESTFLNVMAFEKLHKGAAGKVTSFIILMNNLIDVEQDVALLASNKIIVNALGNDQEAAELFGRLGQGAAMDLNSHITKVHKMVNKHCNKRLNKWCASLKHNYFQHPWAIISLTAASLGFAILILQAVYQICDYYYR